MWDARKLTKPIKVFDELISYYDTTECCFSPEQNLILTGTSAKKDGTGRLVFIDYTTLEIQRVVDVVIDSDTDVTGCILRACTFVVLEQGGPTAIPQML